MDELLRAPPFLGSDSRDASAPPRKTTPPAAAAAGRKGAGHE
jgi:hypothetical protein